MGSYHRFLVVFAIIFAFASIPLEASAQGGNSLDYETDAFTVSLPEWLSLQDEGDGYVAFVNDETSVVIYSASLTFTEQELLNGFEEGITDSLLTILEVLFTGSDKTIDSCSEFVDMPCVRYSDMDAMGYTMQQSTIIDLQNDKVYSIIVRAPTHDEIDNTHPDDILASFQLNEAQSIAQSQSNVFANGNINIRECASTSCAIVGQATDGQVLAVVGQDEDWYEVQWQDGTAYIASWLTIPGPDTYVDLSEGYADTATQCVLYLRTNRGDSDLSVVISGERRSDTWVDIFRPNEPNPLQVNAQYDKTFIDTGEPYILQTYYWNTWWPTGTYQLEIRKDSISSRIAFDIPVSGDHLLYVQCD